MKESFVKYDRKNPPAGVNADGVFVGVDMVLSLGGVAFNDPTKWTGLEASVVSGSYENLVDAVNAGRTPVVILQVDFVYGDVHYPMQFESCSVMADMNGVTIGGIIVRTAVLCWCLTVHASTTSTIVAVQ